DRVLPVRRADRAHGGGAPDLARQLSVGHRLAVGDVAERSPHAPLERCAGGGEGQVELPKPTGEVRVQLADGLLEWPLRVDPVRLRIPPIPARWGPGETEGR